MDAAQDSLSTIGVLQAAAFVSLMAFFLVCLWVFPQTGDYVLTTSVAGQFVLPVVFAVGSGASLWRVNGSDRVKRPLGVFVGVVTYFAATSLAVEIPEGVQLTYFTGPVLKGLFVGAFLAAYEWWRHRPRTESEAQD